jgi:putative ABC transport system permease protein
MIEAKHETYYRCENPARRFWIRTSDIGLNALEALRQNGLRAALTIAGITIGVLAIVTLVAIIKGVQNEVSSQVRGLGANLMLIVPSKLNEDGQPVNPMAMMGISTLSEADVVALQKVPGVEKISPVALVSGVVESSSGKIGSAMVTATTKQGVIMNPTPLAEGRYFEDNEPNPNVCLLGHKPKQELFGDRSALGEKVRIQNVEWTVVGVLSKPAADGSLGSQMLGLSTLVYIPYAAAKKQIPGISVNRIALQTDYNHPAKEMVETMKQALLKTHKGREDFGVITQEKALEIIFKLLNMAEKLLVLIAAISLVVAGVGIMNVMLMSVTERTREVGIRKTVGARSSDIFAQFLTEAVTVSVLGGVLGLLLSWGLCDLIARYSPLTPQITVWLVAMALAVCSIVGTLFGVLPAIRAARLDPIVALRHE